MSKPIAIPRRRLSKLDHSSGSLSCSDNFTQSCPNCTDQDAILIYPGVYSHSLRIISNYNSYKTLCSMIGSDPVSKNMKYSHDYILYYDRAAQQLQNPADYNPTISQFTGEQFWGRVIIVDSHFDHPIIKILEDMLDKHSF